MAHHRHLECGACLQRLGDFVEAGAGLFGQHGAAGLETYGAEFSGIAAAKCAGQQAERRGHGFDDEVDQRLEDHRADAELRVVDRARHRQVDVNHAFAVGQQRRGQAHGQAGGCALHRVTKHQLAQHDLVGGRELPVGQDLVGHVHAEFAALDAVARVFDRVRRHGGQLQVAHLGLDVERQGFGQRVEFAQHFERRRAFGAPAQLEVGHLRRILRRDAGKRAEFAGQLTQVGRVVGPHKAVRERHPPVDQGHGAEGDDGGQSRIFSIILACSARCHCGRRS